MTEEKNEEYRHIIRQIKDWLREDRARDKDRKKQKKNDLKRKIVVACPMWPKNVLF